MAMGIGLVIVAPLILSVHAASSIPSISVLTPTGIRPPHLQAKATLPDSADLIASTPGSIRVRNATYHPIRIALLPQIQLPSNLASSTPQVAIAPPTDIDQQEEPQDSPQYGEPLHWDFVPREGHDNGLILAASGGHVKLQPGDVLTAFAQDGSRRYWGPYVVGVTESPVWNSDTQEWSLVLDTPFPF